MRKIRLKLSKKSAEWRRSNNPPKSYAEQNIQSCLVGNMNYDWYFSLKFYKLEFFASNTKVPEMELFASNYFTAAKKNYLQLGPI